MSWYTMKFMRGHQTAEKLYGGPIHEKQGQEPRELPQYYMADCHEAILDRDTYAKVQVEMERRATMQNPTYCFTGKIRCGICGKSYTRRKGRTKGRDYVSWFCRAKKKWE